MTGAPGMEPPALAVNGTVAVSVYQSVADAQAAASKANDPRVVQTNNVLWAQFGNGSTTAITNCADG